VNDGDIGSAVRRLVVAWLEWHEEIDRRQRGMELEDRVEGWRVVDGGQIDTEGSWEITDAETGELLARGDGLESFDAAWQDGWVHIDRIGDEAHRSSQEPSDDFGLPPGLTRALVDWVVDRPDEARRVIET
jgi:hypothetical protein